MFLNKHTQKFGSRLRAQTTNLYKPLNQLIMRQVQLMLDLYLKNDSVVVVEKKCICKIIIFKKIYWRCQDWFAVHKMKVLHVTTIKCLIETNKTIGNINLRLINIRVIRYRIYCGRLNSLWKGNSITKKWH